MIRRARQIILVFGDIILAYFSLYLTVLLRYWNNFNPSIFWQHFPPFSLMYLFWLILFYVFGLYDLSLIKPKLEFLNMAGKAFLISFILGLAFFYLIPFFGIAPKTNLLIDILIFGILFLLWRRVFYTLFSSYAFQNVCFLGRSALTNDLIKTIKSQPQLGYKFINFLDLKKDIFPQLKRNKADILIISKNINGDEKLTKELYKCLPLRVRFMDLAEASEILFHKIPINFVEQGWFLENLSEGEKKIYNKLKRFSDIILAGIITIISSPLWLILAILIKTEDKGPVFYKQKRVGKNGKAFLLWKFRSMKVGAEKGKPVWAKKEDPRVTKIGKFLRKNHLDELPQMFNILKGDISLVGPRPERPKFVRKLEEEIPYYHLRHIIKPGFTGWAQIKFRYARSLADSYEKFQYDLYYIKNRSLLLDLGILLRTFQLFFKRG